MSTTTTTTVINIPPPIDYEELAGSPKESLTAEGFSATRRIKVRWSDRLTLAQRFLGGKIDGISYYPNKYPHFDDAICVAADPEPFGKVKKDTSKKAKYDYSIVVLKYIVPAYNAQVGSAGSSVRPYRTENLIPSAKMISLSSDSLYWSDGIVLNDVSAPQKVMIQLAWQITLHEVPDKLPSSTFTLIGKVNKKPVKSVQFNKTFAAETLLFTPPKPRPTRRTDGTLTWEAMYELIYQSEGWNKYYNPNTQAFEKIYSDSAGADQVKPYPTADFTPITKYKP